MLSREIDVLIDLIRNGKYLWVACYDLGKAGKFRLTIERTRWITWRTENDKLRVVIDGLVQFLCR